MKQLMILRHGEAGFQDDGMGDFGRQLTTSGKFSLEKLAQVLKERNLVFDLLIKSPAIRTLQTAEIILETVPVREEIEHEQIYGGSTKSLLEIINAIPKEYEKVLLVGHNPGISALVGYLTNDYHLVMTPGMMVVMDIFVPYWSLVTNSSGTLKEVLQ
ncbi:SixA phosphatase family protein [Pararhodonellum marinum]|uniref:SixA phosphatase family protein n=1 Tax=Pararhodonellum marinum TaxID=2755358 RepID=UPI00188F6F19|nr:histidine phosphatase family protein [Pararhodonellum marinum]